MVAVFQKKEMLYSVISILCPNQNILVLLPLHVSLFFFISIWCRLSHSLDDHSRVILQPIEDDPSSDYINANYIDVSGNASNATIGSQRNQRNHTPSLVCQASIPLLRLLVIHHAVLYIQPPRQHIIHTKHVFFVFMTASILNML